MFLGCYSGNKYLCDFNKIRQQLMFWVNKYGVRKKRKILLLYYPIQITENKAPFV